jgi:hypothetical protein
MGETEPKAVKNEQKMGENELKPQLNKIYNLIQIIFFDQF